MPTAPQVPSDEPPDASLRAPARDAGVRDTGVRNTGVRDASVDAEAPTRDGGSGPGHVTCAALDRDDAGAFPTFGIANAVLLVSVDGMAARHVESELDGGTLPAFARLAAEGASTLNARTEARISVTIPNHTSMLTSRPAVEVPGLPAETSHLVLYNSDPGEGSTVHDENPVLGYLTSAFDEVHDRGGRTLLYSSKDKFELYRRSYSAPYSRKDPCPPDDGDDKIDEFEIAVNSIDLIPKFLRRFRTALRERPEGPTFALLHFRETDTAGHSYGWDSSEYRDALLLADTLLGELLDEFSTRRLFERTLVIVTTDHGGTGTGHSDYTDPLVFQIPFFVWGPGVPRGADLYHAALGSRVDPGSLAPLDGSDSQPVRNGDAANLALSLLGLPPIPGSLHTGFRLSSTVPVSSTARAKP